MLYCIVCVWNWESVCKKSEGAKMKCTKPQCENRAHPVCARLNQQCLIDVKGDRTFLLVHFFCDAHRPPLSLQPEQESVSDTSKERRKSFKPNSNPMFDTAKAYLDEWGIEYRKDTLRAPQKRPLSDILQFFLLFICNNNNNNNNIYIHIYYYYYYCKYTSPQTQRRKIAKKREAKEIKTESPEQVKMEVDKSEIVETIASESDKNGNTSDDGNDSDYDNDNDSDYDNDNDSDYDNDSNSNAINKSDSGNSRDDDSDNDRVENKKNITESFDENESSDKASNANMMLTLSDTSSNLTADNLDLGSDNEQDATSITSDETYNPACDLLSVAACCRLSAIGLSDLSSAQSASPEQTSSNKKSGSNSELSELQLPEAVIKDEQDIEEKTKSKNKSKSKSKSTSKSKFKPKSKSKSKLKHKYESKSQFKSQPQLQAESQQKKNSESKSKKEPPEKTTTSNMQRQPNKSRQKNPLKRYGLSRQSTGIRAFNLADVHPFPFVHGKCFCEEFQHQLTLQEDSNLWYKQPIWCKFALLAPFMRSKESFPDPQSLLRHYNNCCDHTTSDHANPTRQVFVGYQQQHIDSFLQRLSTTHTSSSDAPSLLSMQSIVEDSI
ncbi:clumping factor [Reticulomyxa filosa]|uniref:Clumping factor n=1 Tax=Reticulomyxa filosa TaxID=46433 RepID=X6P0V0_RETFI|nr:clumping factor [Reticulomyxa filosa]|eukprot:ETO31758.1 clumping factor [Reticulomyxa filosa]